MVKQLHLLILAMIIFGAAAQNLILTSDGRTTVERASKAKSAPVSPKNDIKKYFLHYEVSTSLEMMSPILALQTLTGHKLLQEFQSLTEKVLMDCLQMALFQLLNHQIQIVELRDN